jgi:hypothetical protein
VGASLLAVLLDGYDRVFWALAVALGCVTVGILLTDLSRRDDEPDEG